MDNEKIENYIQWLVDGPRTPFEELEDFLKFAKGLSIEDELYILEEFCKEKREWLEMIKND